MIARGCGKDTTDVLFDITRFAPDGRIPGCVVHCDYVDVSAKRILLGCWGALPHSMQDDLQGNFTEGSIMQGWAPTTKGCLKFSLAIMSEKSQRQLKNGNVLITHRRGEESKCGEIALEARFNAHVNLGGVSDTLRSFVLQKSKLGKIVYFTTYHTNGFTDAVVMNPHVVRWATR